MAENLVEGDRIRVTYEGVVTVADRFGVTLKTDGGVQVSAQPAIATVTVLEHTKYPVGTLWVAEDKTTGSLFKTSSGWVWDDGIESTADDGSVRQYVANGEGKIVYEPPTA